MKIDSFTITSDMIKDKVHRIFLQDVEDYQIVDENLKTEYIRFNVDYISPTTFEQLNKLTGFYDIDISHYWDLGDITVEIRLKDEYK